MNFNHITAFRRITSDFYPILNRFISSGVKATTIEAIPFRVSSQQSEQYFERWFRENTAMTFSRNSKYTVNILL